MYYDDEVYHSLHVVQFSFPMYKHTHTHTPPRIQMLPGVMLKELAISVSSNDDSYMPKNLVVQVGNREGSLREVKTLTIPRCV